MRQLSFASGKPILGVVDQFAGYIAMFKQRPAATDDFALSLLLAQGTASNLCRVIPIFNKNKHVV